MLDTATFYEDYWLKKKGKYLVQVCRSLACEVCGSGEITRGLCEKLGIEVGETTDDERFTIVELECMGSCGTAPAAIINDVLHETTSLETLSAAIDQLPDDPADYHDPSIDFAAVTHPPEATASSAETSTSSSASAAEAGEDKGPRGGSKKSSKKSKKKKP